MEAMENRLCEAAISGDVESLRKILQDDKLILDKFAVPCFGWTPLHVAVSHGHTDLVTELLLLQPKLAQVLNSAGQSPLHLAAVAHILDSANLLSVEAATQVSDPSSQSSSHLAEAAQVSNSTGPSPTVQVSDSAGQLLPHLAGAVQVSNSTSQSPIATPGQVSNSTGQSSFHLAKAATALDIVRKLVDAALICAWCMIEKVEILFILQQ
ncbi:unnamed protein product [Thlaspi arvense]|uniref:Uncharacterized protein n=1 Tax=Thlaspi arvense TaxID=13288 RepID=A0AAU9RT68_THLAR|nr:unnamed protein product [Thlaspi arvense]